MTKTGNDQSNLKRFRIKGVDILKEYVSNFRIYFVTYILQFVHIYVYLCVDDSIGSV